MFTGKYKMAGRVIEITSFYEKVQRHCADYASDCEPDFSIITSQADIDYERYLEEKCAAAEGRPVREYTDQYREDIAVYRMIAEKMTAYDTFLFHSSAVAVDGQGYLFTAKSGTGKSTHTRLWREYFGDKAIMINDDKPLIQITETGAVIHGTPYNGKHRIGNKISVPLKAVCILERAEENHIERITKADAYTMLVQQILRPREPAQMAKTMQLIDKLAERVELYRLGCNMDISAAEVAYNGMKG